MTTGWMATRGRAWVMLTVTALALTSGWAAAPAATAAAGVAGSFVSVTPARILDTRSGTGAAKAAIGAGGTVHLQVTGSGGVPASGVSAVVLNVTITGPTRAGYVSAYPDGSARPTVSNLNFTAAHTVPNLVVVRVGTSGKVALYNGSSGTTGLIADVAGYYLVGTPTAAGAFASLAPARILDTRSGTGAAKAAVGAGGTVHLQVTGFGGAPASGVSAVVLNVTVAGPARGGFVTAFPDGSARPTVSNLNFTAAQTVPNLVVVRVGTSGKVALYNGSSGTTGLIADVAGYYLAGTPTGAGVFSSLAPARILDTRSGTGAARAAVAAGGAVHLQVTGFGGVPASGVSAVVLNVTVAGPARGGYVSAYRDGSARPTVSNLNFTAGQTVPNLVVVPASTSGKVALYNGSSGTTSLIADVAGYYLAAPVAPPVTDTLVAGQSLQPGQALWSAAGTYAAIMQTDGTFVVYAPGGRATWSSGTGGKPGLHISMQTDGNLVIYPAAGAAAWSSNTAGFSGSFLRLQDDGNLVIYQGSRALWSMGAVLFDRLTPVQSLSANQSLKSPNHQYELIMQGDGNLVIYRSGGVAVWSSTTSGANTLIMQGDGNLVIYRSGGVAVWSSGTAGKAGAYVRIQDDGNLVLYQASAAVWASNATTVPAGWACYSTYNQACVSQFGYTGQRAWGYPVDAWGNNCTNYAAYRVAKNGVANLGNADQWATNARNKGLVVNQTAAVGAIAQWNSTHVAYIDWVSGDGNQIAISETSFGGTVNGKTYTSSSGRRVLTRGASGWPDNIIHF